MPNRVLREGIITSERVNRLTWPAEVFYRRLMSVVDDFGRFYAKPELLRAACYPLKLDTVGNSDVGKWILETEEAALVRKYAVDGKEYLQLLDFRQHKRATASKFPDPPDVCTADALQVQCKGGATEHVGEGEGEGGGGGGRKRLIPDPFPLTDELIAFAESRGVRNRKVIQDFHDRFIDQCKAKGYRYVDFGRTWRNWLRDAITQGKIRPEPKPVTENY